MSDQPMELAPSPSLLQLVKLRSKRTKTARKPVTLENVDIQKAGEIFASLLLYSKAERQQNSSAFVKAACPSHLLINQWGQLSCSFVFSKVETCPVHLVDTRIVGLN